MLGGTLAFPQLELEREIPLFLRGVDFAAVDRFQLLRSLSGEPDFETGSRGVDRATPGRGGKKFVRQDSGH